MFCHLNSEDSSTFSHLVPPPLIHPRCPYPRPSSHQSLPAKWGNRTWHGTRHLQPGFYENGCNCMNLDQATPACQHSAPIRGVGLAYQNVRAGGEVLKKERKTELTPLGTN